MNTLQTNVTVAGIFSKPNFQSEMINQSLIWEKLIILDEYKNWFKVRQFDQYEGWINKFYTLSENQINDNFKYVKEFKLINTIYTASNKNSQPILNCTFGSKIPYLDMIKTKNSTWYNVVLPNKNSGWIDQKNVSNTYSIRDFIEKNIKNFIGIPYLWGGRSSYGFDCSGFVQTIFNFFDVKFPRDSIDQYKFDYLQTQDKKYNKVGDLLFFKKNNKINHVAISLGADKYIHASGFIKVNSLNRHDNDFNQSLYSIYECSKSIESLTSK